MTRGEKGLLVADSNGLHHIPGIQAMKRIDPVGAGDTIASALALCLGAQVGRGPADRLVPERATVLGRAF